MGQYAQWVITILGSTAVGSAIGALIKDWFQRRKTGAEAHSIDTESEIKLATSLRSHVDNLMGQVTQLTTDKQTLLIDNASLQAKLAMGEATQAILEGDLKNTLREITQMRSRLDQMESAIKQRIENGGKQH